MWAWQGSCGRRWWRLTTIRLYPSVPLVLKGCPLSRGCPVLSSHANVVQPRGVVSSSLGSACGPNGPSWFKPTGLLRRHGGSTLRVTPTCLLMRFAVLRSGFQQLSWSRSMLSSSRKQLLLTGVPWRSQTSSWHGASGRESDSPGVSQAWSRCPQGAGRGHREPGQDEPYGDGWEVGQQVSTPAQPVPSAPPNTGTPSSSVSSPYVMNAGSTGMTPTAALQTLAVVASGVAMAYREPLGPGAYVVQAMEESSGSDPAWTSDTAMEKMAEARVRSWRESFGLQSDDDFGFAFDCYENAVAFGGHHVANAWVAVRAAIMDAGELIPAAAQVIQPGSSVDVAPKVVAKKPSMLKGAKGKPKLRLRTGPDQPEQLELRISVLSRAFLQAGALHPGGHLSPERIIDWQRACRDLAQTKVTAAEPATILNALKTFAELQKFQKDRERQLPPDELDLHSFLLNGTKSAQRALNSLKWFCKHGRLSWPVQKLLLPPEAPAERQRRQQAIAVEPPMLRALEEKIQSLHEAGDERWLALLSSWLIAFGVLRFKHLQRSRPIKITQGSFHAHCAKGKQTSKRGGFDFAASSNLTTGWPWGQYWFQTWSKLPEETRAQSGLCFDAQGNPFSLSVATTFTQQCFQHLVENPKELTSYSWRRVGPTAGQFLGFDTMQLNSLGDWQDNQQFNDDHREGGVLGGGFHFSF